MDLTLMKHVACRENLFWALQTFARHETWHGKWYDRDALTAMEADTQALCQRLKQRITQGDFSPHPIQSACETTLLGPQPHPEDQILWVALTQIIGPMVEEAMPSWSYGSRLHRSEWIHRNSAMAWYKKGWFRRTAGRLYRHPTRVWPGYRRHILQAARAMTGLQSEFDIPGFFRGDEGRIQLPPETAYLKGLSGLGAATRLYWACFTVSPPLDALDAASRGLRTVPLDDDVFIAFDAMLKGYTKLPEALSVSGFLHNISMLPVDVAVEPELKTRGLTGRVAHFRYDREHIIIARDAESLSAWISAYEELLDQHGLGAIEKATLLPRSVARGRTSHDHGVRLDAINPLPEVTRPVEVMADLHNVEYTLLDRKGKRDHITRLEQLLLETSPGTPVSERLRIDFSSALLSRRAADASEPDYACVCTLERDESEPAEGDSARLLYRERVVSVRQRQRSLLVILEAAERNPHIPALWTRALEHMARSGFGSLSPMMERLPKPNPSTMGLRSLLAIRMAEKVTSCARVLLKSGGSESGRQSALTFLETLVREGTAMEAEASPLWEQSIAALANATEAARCVLAPKEIELPPNTAIEKTDEAGIQANLFLLGHRHYAFPKIPPKTSVSGIPLNTWVAQLPQEQAAYFDPRASEWTALFVARHCCRTLLESTPDPLTSSRVLIPSAWQPEGGEIPSWEMWRRNLLHHPPVIADASEETVPEPLVDGLQGDYDSWVAARSVALLLLGILRRRFDLPAPLAHPFGHLISRPWHPLVETLSISSATRHLLLGVLEPRQLETLMLRRSDHASEEDDTQLDPPPLGSLKAFLSAVEGAMDLLEQHQAGGGTHHPRQLIPVSMVHHATGTPGFHENGYQNTMRIGFIQTTTDARAAWRGGPRMSRAEGDHAWHQIREGFRILTHAGPAPAFVVIPELALPVHRLESLKRLSIRSGVSVVSGVDYLVNRGTQEVRNRAVVTVPRHWPFPRQAGSCNTFWFGKSFMAPPEKVGIDKSGHTFVPDPAVWIIDAGGYGRIGVCICYDFMDVERYAIYRGRIQHLFVLAYNRDIDSFYHLADALSKTLYCNVVICNTGFYGGSLAVSPYYEPWRRTLYRQEGANLFSVQSVSLPVADLVQAQTGQPTEVKLFKSLPPAYRTP